MKQKVMHIFKKFPIICSCLRFFQLQAATGPIGGAAYYGGQAQPGAAQGSSYPGYPAAAAAAAGYQYGGQPGGADS